MVDFLAESTLSSANLLSTRYGFRSPSAFGVSLIRSDLYKDLLFTLKGYISP